MRSQIIEAIGIIISLLFICGFTLAAFASIAISVVEITHGPEKCKELGSEWVYVSGRRSPSVCATKDGRSVYYSTLD